MKIAALVTVAAMLLAPAMAAPFAAPDANTTDILARYSIENFSFSYGDGKFPSNISFTVKNLEAAKPNFVCHADEFEHDTCAQHSDFKFDYSDVAGIFVLAQKVNSQVWVGAMGVETGKCQVVEQTGVRCSALQNSTVEMTLIPDADFDNDFRAAFAV